MTTIGPGRRVDVNEASPTTGKESKRKRNLYDVLRVSKTATEEEIKRAYRSLALRYHPDKTQNDPEAAEEFKEINYANTVLSDHQRRRVYDSWGIQGVKMMDQFGEEQVATVAEVCSKRWVKWLGLTLFVATLGCFCGFCFCCCCFQCCCNFCCGEFAPGKAAEKMRRDHERTKTQLQTVKPSTGEGCPVNRKGSSKSGQVLKFVPEG